MADVAVGCSAPNDCAVGPDHRLWFTDPPRQAAGSGRVCAFDPRTSAVETVADEVAFPNGIAFADRETLIVVDTERHALLRYRLAERRLIAEGVLAQLPGAGPDGIAFDAAGRLFVAAFDANEVIVVAPDGAVDERIPLPAARPTNLCFAGADLETLVVTCASGGRVLALDGSFRGRPVP